MKLSLHFGLTEPKRTIYWHGEIGEFPTLILFKGSKWEFVLYQRDDTGVVDYICNFSEVPPYDPNFHATTYKNIDHLFESYGRKCECGAIYTSFPWDHMRMCPKWERW